MDYVGELPDTSEMPEDIPLDVLHVAGEGGQQEPAIQADAAEKPIEVFIDSDGHEGYILSDEDEYFVGPF